MNTNYKTTDWTIGECCTKATGVVLSHFRGTAAEVQILLLKMVKQLKNIDSGEYVHGTETLKELTSEHEEYTAAAVFWSYEVKITAKETCHVKEITDKYVVGDFKATDEKMQELKKGLKSNHEALENFLGGETYFPVAVYEKGKCGFYLYVPDEMDDTLPVEN